MTRESRSDTYLLGSEESTHLRYRLFNDIYLPGTLQRVSDLQISPDMAILDIGCGIGDTACYFAQHLVPNGHVTAFDQAPDLIDIANRRAAELGLENIDFVCAKAQDFPFPSEQFDIAHTRYVLSYLSDADDVLRKIYSALKPSGVFFGEEIAQTYIKHGRTEWYERLGSWFAGLVELGGGNPNYGVDQMASDVLGAGFVDIQASAYWPVEDQQKVVDMLRIALSREMKQNLVDLGVATEKDVDEVVSELARPDRNYVISASMAVQIIGRKVQP